MDRREYISRALQNHIYESKDKVQMGKKEEERRKQETNVKRTDDKLEKGLTWTTHSRVSGMATGVHQATNTGSLRLTLGRIP